MMNENLSRHEMMELHEILNFKTICMTTSILMQGIVFDQDLKALMEKDVQQSLKAVNELRTLYSQAPTLQ